MRTSEGMLAERNFMWSQIILLLNQNKSIVNKVNFCDIKICFHSIKINFYSIKYICMVSKYILFNQNKFQFNKIYLWYQNIFLFSQNKFVFKKKRFYYITYFHPIKIFLYYMNFSFDTFLVTISGLPFLFAKVRILLSVCKLKSSTML